MGSKKTHKTADSKNPKTSKMGNTKNDPKWAQSYTYVQPSALGGYQSERPKHGYLPMKNFATRVGPILEISKANKSCRTQILRDPKKQDIPKSSSTKKEKLRKKKKIYRGTSVA
jgi:hypothetical protein